MTNREIIKQIFPNLIEYVMGDNNLVVVYIDKARINIPKDYWNAEFKEPNDTKTITISKGAVKHGNKDYVVYKRDWLMEHLDSEFKVLKEAKNLMKKIQNAKPSTWLTDGLTQEEVKQIIDDAKEQAKRDCEKCKHRIPTVDIVKGKSIYGCESWECKFEQK